MSEFKEVDGAAHNWEQAARPGFQFKKRNSHGHFRTPHRWSRFQFLPHSNNLAVVLVSEFTALCTSPKGPLLVAGLGGVVGVSALGANTDEAGHAFQ